MVEGGASEDIGVIPTAQVPPTFRGLWLVAESSGDIEVQGFRANHVPSCDAYPTQKTRGSWGGLTCAMQLRIISVWRGAD
ncbi:hypothetical protein PM082_007106 [Marasmius tenuissimus]|nr:hypothetical protein PM082_007106 [Marasmius tenuissimus]